MADADNTKPADTGAKLPPTSARVKNAARPRRLRKNVIVGLIAVFAGVLLLALVLGISKNPVGGPAAEVQPPAIADASKLPGFVKTGPKSYADVPPPPAPPAEPAVPLGPAMHGDLAAAGVPAPVDSPFEGGSLRTKPEADQRQAQEWQAVLDGPVELNVKLDLGGAGQGALPGATSPNRAAHGTASPAGLAGIGTAALAQPEKALPSSGKQTETGSEFYLNSGLQAPRSAYELKSGSVIPCTLITGIDSDLPGNITCQVRQAVFDTVTGQHLLVPQGARAIGEYDAKVLFGQRRVLVVWRRLLMPNGSSLDLGGMPGVDRSGYAGYADKVDNHWGRLTGAVVLSSVFAAAPVAVVGDDTGFNRTVESEIARNIGQNVQKAGDQIVQRELAVQPSITVRPGFAINIFVNKDLILTPYTEHQTHEIGIGKSADSDRVALSGDAGGLRQGS